MKGVLVINIVAAAFIDLSVLPAQKGIIVPGPAWTVLSCLLG